MSSYNTPGVYIKEVEIGSKPIEGVSTSVAAFIGMTEKGDMNKPTLITSWAEFISKFGRYVQEKEDLSDQEEEEKRNKLNLSSSVYGFFQNGGKRCYIVRVSNTDATSIIGTDGGPGNRTGIHSLKEIDEISIVAAPGITDKGVQKAIIQHCEEMKDRFAILDMPEDTTKAKAETYIEDNELGSKNGYAAIYYPWIKVFVELEKEKETTGEGGETTKETSLKLEEMFVPPSGYIAGVYARTDSERGVHKAPANETIAGVIELKVKITNADQDGLNKKNINCIRSFPGRGIRVWGARTIASNSLWRYVNVRRLFLYIEESIEEGIQWVVFEPNDKNLWDRVSQSISAFLLSLWRDGALMGSTPEEAFFVKCDETTMTQDDINNGRLVCEVGIAPVRPAEFVIIKIAQLTASANK
ncbi:phage tail sheath subtilisin-like domain-containing protein [Persephonella sp.]